MCLEASFSLFYRDALNLQPPKIYAAQRCPAVFRFDSPPIVITAPCDAPFSIPLYQCAFCSITAPAHRSAQITRRQETST